MAALSDVKICNIALAKLGATAITALNPPQDKKEAKVCNRLYDQTRDEVLRAHPWNFATVRAELTQLSDDPISDYSYQYQLPTSPKCLRVLEVTGSDVKWVIEGDRLLTDDSVVEIRYIERETAPTKFDTLFVDALATKLASKMAIPLTSNLQVKQIMDNEYRVVMLQARGISNVERDTRDHEPEEWGDISV